MNVISHNLASMFTNRQLGITTNNKAKSSEKLSSGYRINRAADDAAGLSISEKMRKQIRGLSQGASNIQDGISLIQVADGYLNEVHDILHRINELAIKSANGTNSESDRNAINDEVQKLKEETNRIFKTAKYNEIKLFEGPYKPNVEIIPNTNPPSKRTVAYQISTVLPPGVVIDDDTAANGYMSAGPYTAADGVTYQASAVLDFTNINLSDLSALDGTGFFSTCCTCHDYYSITFDSTTSSHSESGSTHHTYSVGIQGCTTPEDIVQRIIDATGGRPNDHFTNYEVDVSDPKKLVVYDNRPSQTASPGFGLFGAGVKEERIITDTLGPNGADIQVFNIGPDSSGKMQFGGVEINNVRHTWDELGFELSGDGKTFASDHSIEFYDYTGERVSLWAKAGTRVPEVTRNYVWDADPDGIYVNNVFAASWEDIGIKDKGNFGEYSFQFRNMEISFTVNDGDDLNDVISGINAKALNDRYSWDLSIGSYETRTAAQICNTSTQIVTNNNTSASDYKYTIVADSTGITLADDSGTGITHTKVSWEDFANKGTPTLPAGSNPIADWGLNDIDGMGTASNRITLDDQAIYHYEDIDNPDLPISFDFTLADEASLEAVISALNNVEFTLPVDAPGNMTASVSSTVSVHNAELPTSPTVSVSSNNMDFKMQRLFGRDFDDPNGEIKGEITQTFDAGTLDPAATTVVNGPEKTVGQDPPSSVTPGSGTVWVKEGNEYVQYDVKEEIVKVEYVESVETTTEHYNDASFTYSGQFGNTANTWDGGNHSQAIQSVNSGPFSYEVVTEKKTVQKVVTYKNVYTEKPNSRTTADPGVPMVQKDETEQPPRNEGSPTTTTTVKKSKVSNNLDIKTADNSNPVNLKLSTDLTGWENGDSANIDLTFKASDYAKRKFDAVANTAGNINESGNFSEVEINGPQRYLWIQASDNNPDGIKVYWDSMNNTSIGISRTDVSTVEGARKAIDQVGKAMSIVSYNRSVLGAEQNRLEHAHKINLNTHENTSSAESLIRDTDMADEMVRFSKESILQQAGQSMLAQANQQPQSVLQLLQ